MADIPKVRLLLQTMREAAEYLTDEEIAAIGVILLGAVERAEREALNEGELCSLTEIKTWKVRFYSVRVCQCILNG